MVLLVTSFVRAIQLTMIQSTLPIKIVTSTREPAVRSSGSDIPVHRTFFSELRASMISKRKISFSTKRYIFFRFQAYFTRIFESAKLSSLLYKVWERIIRMTGLQERFDTSPISGSTT